MYGAAHVVAIVRPLHVDLVGLAPTRRKRPAHHKPVSAVLKPRMALDHHDALDAEVMLATEALAVMDLFHPMVMLELFVTEMSFMPSMILVPIPVFVMAVGVPLSMPVARILFVLVGIAVAIVIAVMLRESGNTRCNAKRQNRRKAYSNQSHRFLSTAK